MPYDVDVVALHHPIAKVKCQFDENVYTHDQALADRLWAAAVYETTTAICLGTPH